MINREAHTAVVSDNQDPEKRGRIRVTCAALMGSDDVALPHWIDPDFEWGWFIVPDVGEFVEISHTDSTDDDESHGQTSIHAPNYTWKGRHWGGSETDTARPVPDDFTSKNYGKRRGFATPGGHILMFDDTDGQKQVSITWHGKDDEYQYQSFNPDGSFVISNKNGSLIYANAADKEMALVCENGNSITMSPTGIAAIDKFGNFIDMKDGQTQVVNSGSVNVSCKNVTIDAGKIELTADAPQKAVLGDLFLALFKGHVHPGPFGPSGPPTPTGTEDETLSTKVKLG